MSAWAMTTGHEVAAPPAVGIEGLLGMLVTSPRAQLPAWPEGRERPPGPRARPRGRSREFLRRGTPRRRVRAPAARPPRARFRPRGHDVPPRIAASSRAIG